MKPRRHTPWILAGLCGLLFILLALLLEKMGPVDEWAHGLVAGTVSPFATGFWMLCTMLGSWPVLLALCFALVLFLPRREYRVPLLLNMMLSVLLNLALKSLFVRPRPGEAVRLIVESGYSFPSGHTMAAACFYGFLMFLVGSSDLSKGKKKLLWAFLSLIVILVGLSRVYLGVHFFSDVLGGLLCSVAYLAPFTAFVMRYFSGEKRSGPLPATAHKRGFLSSFSFAFEGILASFKAERNMVIHLGMMVLVVVFGALVGLSGLEWMICILLFGLVLMAELLNTALETLVDMVSPQVDPRAKLVKDTAAGAVLVAAIAAALVGAIIFVPKLLALFQAGLSH